MRTIAPRLTFAGLALLASCAEAPSEPRTTPLISPSFDIVSGDAQVGVAGAELAQPLVVRATANGKRLAGVLVNFRVTSGAGRMYAGSSITDNQGLAQDYWTLGTDAANAQRVEVVAVNATTGVKQSFATFTARMASGNGPSLVASPAQVNLQLTAPNPSATVPITITNNGLTAATGMTATISGANAAGFEITGNSCTGSLGFGQACTVSVRAIPLAPGSGSATLSVTPAGGVAAIVPLSVSAIGRPASFSITPATWDFGSVNVGSTSSPKVFTVQNVGDFPSFNVGAAASLPFAVSANTCPTTLSGGASCTVSAVYAPVAGSQGAESGQVHVSATGASGVVDVSGFAVVPQPSLSASPSTVAFGSAVVRYPTASTTITVTNNGTGTATMLSPFIRGNDPSSFAITGGTCSGATLTTGQSCTVAVQFDPQSAGVLSARLDVQPSGFQIFSVTTLGGTGVNPAPRITASPSPIDFLTALVGSSTASRVITVTSDGNVPVTGIYYMFQGPNPTSFEITSETCQSATLAPGQTCTVSVRFKPQSAGALSSRLDIGQSGGPAWSVDLSGTGVNPLPTLTASPTPINFSSAPVGSFTSPTVITVTSTGNVSATGIYYMFRDPNPTSFEITSETCQAATLAPGQTCTVSVRFKPQSAGALSSRLDIGQSGGPAYSVDLRGTGTTPAQIVLSPTSHSFGTLTSPAGLSVSMQNTGGSDATFALSVSGAGFTLSPTQFCPTNGVLPAGGSCAISVVASPTNLSPGTYNGTLSVNTSAGNFTVSLSFVVP